MEATQSLQEILQLDRNVLHGLGAKVQCLIDEAGLIIPDELAEIIQLAGLSCETMLKGDNDDADYLVWCPDINGEFSVKSAFDSIRVSCNEAAWCSFIWASCVHPKLSATAWKLVRNGVTTETRAQSVGITLASCCRACYNGEDSVSHLLWQCQFAKRLWEWCRHNFRSVKSTNNLKEVMKMERNWSPLIKHLWQAAVVGGMVALWQQRNSMIMEGKNPNFGYCCSFIGKQVQLAAKLSTAKSFNNAVETYILEIWHLHSRLGPGFRVLECRWIPPIPSVIKVNTDGPASNSVAGIGMIFRNHECQVHLVAWQNIGAEDSYFAECSAIVSAGEIAISQGWLNLWIESDAEAVVASFRQFKIPWKLKQRWVDVTRKLASLMISSVWREVNFSADKASKKALSNPTQQLEVNFGKPSWIQQWENHDTIYYRFSYKF